ncbi:MAG: hypothetical protein KatS3mg060_1444 [Dehalococcoidia bacterium]|jgi:bacterioferritin-associated ferredoxin|nr:MAG: hypothetical protein KatS3mg060_1444 [Dehalococcoidia bacterium]
MGRVMYICLCRGLTEADIEAAGRAGHTTADDLIAVLGLDHPRCCGRCQRDIDDFVDLAERAARPVTTPLVQA